MQRIRRADENAAWPGQNRTVRTFFYDHILWPQLVDFFERSEHVVFLRQLMRLAVVEHKTVNALEQLQQIRQCDVQPQVHRVGYDEFGPPHLVQHVKLERRRDVGQQDELGVLMRLRQFGRERLKHAQLGQQRAAIVHVRLVFARPVKRFAGQNLQAFEINFVPVIKPDVFFGEIGADDANQFHRAEKARGDGGVAGRAAQQARIFRSRSLDGIQRRRTDNENAHFKLILNSEFRVANF